MKNKVGCIMLVDDNSDDNYYHARIITKYDPEIHVLSMQSGLKALSYLKDKESHPSAHPDIIILDINMPGMNGWEFLDECSLLSPELQSSVVVVMLTTSENPDDKAKAYTHGLVCDFQIKPLTREMLEQIIVRLDSNLF